MSVYNGSIDHPALSYTTLLSLIKVWSMLNTLRGRKIAWKYDGWYRFVGFAIVPSTKLNSIRGHLPADSAEDRHVLAVSETLSRNRVIVNFPWSVCGGSGAISNLSRRIGHSWFYFELIRVHFLSLENVLVWWDLNANDAWSIRARRNFEWRKKFFPFISPFILLRKEVENFLYLLFSAVLQILYS